MPVIESEIIFNCTLEKIVHIIFINYNLFLLFKSMFAIQITYWVIENQYRQPR